MAGYFRGGKIVVHIVCAGVRIGGGGIVADGLGKGDIFGTGEGFEPVLGGKSCCVGVLLEIVGTAVVGRVMRGWRLEIFKGVALVNLKRRLA